MRLNGGYPVLRADALRLNIATYNSQVMGPAIAASKSQTHHRSPRLRVSSAIQATAATYTRYQQIATVSGTDGITRGAITMDTP
jgi:hypothetical protein